MPAGIEALPADRPLLRFAGADGLDATPATGAEPSRSEWAKSSTPSMVPKSPAWPEAPPSAKAFSSCTSPRITRPRQVQRSVAAQSVGSGRKEKLFRQRLIDQRLSGDALDGDAEQHEVDVGIDRRPALPDALQDEGAQGLGILAVGVERLDRRADASDAPGIGGR